ncbi:MAG: hypothetical protein IKI68_05280, partial [Clostridia bacterium]|nr:hypothetical protein [Clostridia bacterium]
MQYIELFGQSISREAEEIKRAVDADVNVVFIYSGQQMLYDYIDDLNKTGLDSGYLYKFKVCYEKKDLRISYFSQDGKSCQAISSMSSLINELDGRTACKIVVENNDRVQLAFIVQQLIFIEYPLDKVDILIRREERDAEKTKRFMRNVDVLLENCESAIARLLKLRQTVAAEADENNETKQGRLAKIDDALGSCVVIRKRILKAKDVELKFAVAASKKAGKSVIVNCFLGEQIAPTSTELATPNNCIYKKSSDNMYH